MPNSTIRDEWGSALKWRVIIPSSLVWNTYEEAQPINGFSQRSFVSHSIFHFFVLCVPDCIAFRAGIKIRQRRSLKRSRGTPDRAAIFSCETKKRRDARMQSIEQRTSCRGISVNGVESAGFWVSTAVRPHTFCTSNKVLEIQRAESFGGKANDGATVVGRRTGWFVPVAQQILRNSSRKQNTRMHRYRYLNEHHSYRKELPARIEARTNKPVYRFDAKVFQHDCVWFKSTVSICRCRW